jgi:hypothetical protein
MSLSVSSDPVAWTIGIFAPASIAHLFGSESVGTGANSLTKIQSRTRTGQNGGISLRPGKKMKINGARIIQLNAPLFKISLQAEISDVMSLDGCCDGFFVHRLDAFVL